MPNQLLKERASDEMHAMLETAHKSGASDLFISAGFPPSIKCHGIMRTLSTSRLTPEMSRAYAMSIMEKKQQDEFAQELECNFAIDLGFSRFRVNVFIQKQCIGMVIRTIPTEIPSFEKLKLPAILKDIIMVKRGLVFMVGSSGSGKSTSLAAMIDHRNMQSTGHIITVEDPIEYVHESKNSLVTQREIAVDTQSWTKALKNALRQAPDVIFIGEIRDTETMDQAISFAESGHLCVATLHATSANQTFDRVINFFPEERRKQLLMDLASHVHAVISQRLVPAKDGTCRVAAEIMLNTPTLSEIILKGQFHTIKDYMTKSRELGMQTFDQALLDLYNEGAISHDEAVHNADSKNEVRLNIKLQPQQREIKAAPPDHPMAHLRRATHSVRQ
ncbi:MAG: PilT/PilU family type 4a pilus ATPase [Burkholderiaceae bacterium]